MWAGTGVWGARDDRQLINRWIERNGKQLVFEDGVSRFRNQEKRIKKKETNFSLLGLFYFFRVGNL